MPTQSFAVTGGTPLLALTGRYMIRQIQVTAAAATNVSAIDAGNTTLTQSNAAYDNKARTYPYTRTRAAVTDIYGNSNDYQYTGARDQANTVPLAASYTIPAQESVSLPAAGQIVTDCRFQTTRGLLLTASATATVTVTYEPVP